MLHFLPDLFSRSVGNNTTVATVFLNMFLYGAESGGKTGSRFIQIKDRLTHSLEL
jgi:hypothetical protein